MQADKTRCYREIRTDIAHSFNQLNALYSHWARLRGINRNQLYFFFCMENRESCTPSQLSEEWLISKQTLTGILKDLQKNGFILISPNPEDKRSKLITLTEKGKLQSERILTPMREIELSSLQRLGLEQSQQLMHANHAYLQAFKAALELEQQKGN